MPLQPDIGRQKNEKSRWHMWCRCGSDLMFLEFKIAAVTKSVKEHTERGFLCLEATSWRLLPVSVIHRVIQKVNNETYLAFWQSFNIAIFSLLRASMPTFFEWRYLKKKIDIVLKFQCI